MKRDAKRTLKHYESEHEKCMKMLAAEKKKKKPDGNLVGQYERQLSKLDHKIKCEKNRVDAKKAKAKKGK